MVNATSASEAAFSIRSESVRSAMIAVTPASLSFAAFSLDRTRAVNDQKTADGWERSRSRTVPPMYPSGPSRLSV